ncbi:MAG: hypothetical protein JNG84_11280 [Archangium sp.]|nr:hypothetical protein [Archangium sp.]
MDESDEVVDRSQMERAADRYAVAAALGDDPPAPPSGAALTHFQRFAVAASVQAKARGIDLGSLLWYWTGRTRDFPMGMLALKAAYKHLGGARAIREKFDEYVDLDSASDSDRALLRCVKGDPEADASPR